ncbi:MAG: hypothetical protein ABW219_17610 [Ilumatobacteraceae bacterium]
MTVPALPPPGTTLDRDTAAKLATEIDDWVSDVGSQLVDLDAEVQSGTDAQRADLAEAFILWRAVSERTDRWEGVADADGRAAAVASSWTPVTTSTGETVGRDLPDAIGFLDALVTRLAADLAADAAAAADAARAWVALDADLDAARRAAARLGQEVRHVAELAAAAATHPRAIVPPGDLVTRAAETRAGLEAAERERQDVVAALAAAPAVVAELEQREATVRELAERCRAKILHAPNLAVPSVAAIGPAPAVAERPWASVQGPAQAWLRQVERVGAALDEASRRFRESLDRRDELRGLLQAFRDKADSAGLAEHDSLDERYSRARGTLWSAPCDLDAAEVEVDDYLRTVNQMIHGVN